MENIKPHLNYKKELIELIEKYIGARNFKSNDDLERDLGMTGDDAFEFIIEYGKIFNVNVSQFPICDYFYDEGNNFFFLISKISGRYKKKQFTIENLTRGIEEGYLK